MRRPSRSWSSDRLGIPIENVVDRARRHRQGAVRHGHLRLALAARSACARSSRRSTRSIAKAQEGRRPSCSKPPKPTSNSRTASSRVAGTDKTIAFGEVALHGLRARTTSTRPELEPGLNEERLLRSDRTSPSRPACHICRGGGRPGDRRDRRSRNAPRSTTSATIINPMIVEGQVHGGIAQGIGQALLEGCRLRHASRPARSPASYMDYTMPRADDLPSFELGIDQHAVHRTTRWASRAAARPARSPRRRRSSTRIDRCARASRTSPCRRRRTSCGRPFSQRRQGCGLERRVRGDRHHVRLRLSSPGIGRRRGQRCRPRPPMAKLPGRRADPAARP